MRTHSMLVCVRWSALVSVSRCASLRASSEQRREGAPHLLYVLRDCICQVVPLCAGT